MAEKSFNYTEGVEAISRAATHAKKEWTAFEGVLGTLKMAQAAKTEAVLFQSTQEKHAKLKKDYDALDGQHKVKLGAQTAELAAKKAGQDDDLRAYVLKLESDLKKAKADHDRKMSGMNAKKDNLQGEIDVMESEKEKLTKSLASLRSEARAHAQRAAVAAVGAP